GPVGMELAQERLDASKRQIGAALESFAENTIEYLRDEREYLIEAIRLPEIDTDLAGRHVLVVVRGHGYKADLASLRGGYISDFRPVLVGVDGGADALLDIGLRPDILLGHMDSVTTLAPTRAAALLRLPSPGSRRPRADPPRA